MLGFLTAITGLVSRQAMEKAIETTVKAKTVSMNLRAFTAGYQYTAVREHTG
jgi:Pyruvate/2-oxoacid:ferredoxin oxidoreductase gamma subunit